VIYTEPDLERGDRVLIVRPLLTRSLRGRVIGVTAQSARPYVVTVDGAEDECLFLAPDEVRADRVNRIHAGVSR
jgi:hypothetical protein